jgi:hypothetical protein
MTISLRNLSTAALRWLRASARKPPRNSDLNEFFGTWSSAEADAFDAALAGMRKVDPADWESTG